MSGDSESNAERSLAICSLFESELLVWLLLRSWGHPLAEDANFRSSMLESATEVLTAAARGPESQIFIADMPARDMNLVSAIWYSESCAADLFDSSSDPSVRQRRLDWLDDIRRALPSCFCSQDALPPNDGG